MGMGRKGLVNQREAPFIHHSVMGLIARNTRFAQEGMGGQKGILQHGKGVPWDDKGDDVAVRLGPPVVLAGVLKGGCEVDALPVPPWVYFRDDPEPVLGDAVG